MKITHALFASACGLVFLIVSVVLGAALYHAKRSIEAPVFVPVECVAQYGFKGTFGP